MELSPNSSHFSSPKSSKNKNETNNFISSPISSHLSSANKSEGKEDTINQTKIDAKKVLDNPENRKISKQSFNLSIII